VLKSGATSNRIQCNDLAPNRGAPALADDKKAEPMRSAYQTLNTESDSEAERIFSPLSDGGQVLMPMQETFFASRFGQLRDRFGINWMIVHERPMSAT